MFVYFSTELFPLICETFQLDLCWVISNEFYESLSWLIFIISILEVKKDVVGNVISFLEDTVMIFA